MVDSVQSTGVLTQLDATNRRLLGDHVPAQLQAITEDHFSKLIALVETMHSAGIAESLVRHSIRELVASYEAELVSVMTCISQETQK